MSFSQKIRKYAEKVKVGYDEAVGNSLLGVSRSIIMMTPVGDDGHGSRRKLGCQA